MYRSIALSAAALTAFAFSTAHAQTVTPGGTVDREGTVTPGGTVAATPEPGASGQPSTSGEYSAAPQPGSRNYEIERQRIWNSPEFARARVSILERSRVARGSNVQRTQQQLVRLGQLSPAQMRTWLDRYREQQASIARAQEVERLARQQSVGQAFDRLRSTQQSYANINRAHDEAALQARQQLQNRQVLAGQRSAGLQVARDAQIASSRPDYSWVIFPSLYTRWAASASLPGDLPRGDPLNSISGDVVANDRTGAVESAGVRGPGGTTVTVGGDAGAGAGGAGGGGAAPGTP